MPTSRDPQTPPLDLVGAGASVVGLGSLVWAIISAGEHGWTGQGPLAGFAVAAVAAVGFVLWERRTPHPMLDVSFFEDRRFTAASLAVVLGYFALFGSLFLITQLLQFVLGFSPLAAGVRLLPFALAMAVFSMVSTKLVDRFGTKVVVAAGLGILAVGLLWMASCGSGSTYADLLPAMLLMGTGVALTWAPTTESIMGSVPAEKAGVGSAVNDTVREIGGALGVAVLGSVLASRYTGAVGPATGALPEAAARAAGDSLGGAFVVAQQVGGAAGETMLDAARLAFLDGFGVALTVAAVVAAAAAAMAAIWLPAHATEADVDVDAAALLDEHAATIAA